MCRGKKPEVEDEERIAELLEDGDEGDADVGPEDEPPLPPPDAPPGDEAKYDGDRESDSC